VITPLLCGYDDYIKRIRKYKKNSVN